MMTPNATILVVDDEPQILAFLALILEDEGYHVLTATNGYDALAKTRDCVPDAILLDMLMPLLDGAGFLRECRASPVFGGVPVLLMSALGTKPHAETLGAQGILSKPFDYDLLLTMLASVL
jgi:CheY-like chemotaxis protein